MRPPLWILNSALLLLLFAAMFFILVSRVTIPERESIEPEGYIKPIAKRVSEVNLRKIYEHDLFDTYVPELEGPKEPSYVTPLPLPPAPKPVHVPPEPKPQFLKPLEVSLKGIIIVANDDSKNRIVLADNKTKKEKQYKVGDSVEDAQLIKIFSNKVLFLRSNGQQEVLYLRPKDAQLDPAYAIIGDWKQVVRKISDNSYAINMNEFTFRVRNLAQFIDLLDLTTVYQKGASIGCRIGKLPENSLGGELGLQSGDIILTVNGVPATDTAHRMAIYKDIVAMKTKESIIVELLRNKAPLTIKFTLEEERKPSAQRGSVGKVPTEEVTQEQLKMLQERHKFAPTLRDIRQRERNTMMQKGQAPGKKLTNAGLK